MQSPYTIIFIGPQGSGKGTQIEKLDGVLKEIDPARNVIDIQTGRRFRALAAREEGYTEKMVGTTLNSGILQPLFLSVVLWGDAMREHLNEERHVLIDGFPRTVAEAEVLETALTFYKRERISVINLETPEPVVRARMIGRARPDDTPESIEARLKWYREETIPVVSYYRKRINAEVHDIDGTMPIEEVHAAIRGALGI